MLSFSAILLCLVYTNEWKRQPDSTNGPDLSTGFNAQVYYVRYSPTRLIRVASWSSSTVFTLMGSFMTLLSTFIAAEIIRSSTTPLLHMLPTPRQLALLVDLLDGKRGALWQWFQDLFRRKSKKTRNIWMVEISAAIQIFAICLSCAIIGADTWLHVSTESVSMPYFQIIAPSEGGHQYWFGEGLTEMC